MCEAQWASNGLYIRKMNKKMKLYSHKEGKEQTNSRQDKEEEMNNTTNEMR